MLENKLGITNPVELALEEEKISKKKAKELFEKNMLVELPAGKFSTLQFIHKYLFDEVYNFAGQIRDVNISKGNFRLWHFIYIV